MTVDMIEAPTLSALSISARRILDALMAEHCRHAGKLNGKLILPYRQWERFGVTKADIGKGLAELIVTGFVERKRQGLRLAGTPVPSEFALTWLPTVGERGLSHDATDRWRHVLVELRKSGVTSPKAVRAWLRNQVGDRARSKARRAGNVVPLGS
jgi:hypothetical protein